MTNKEFWKSVVASWILRDDNESIKKIVNDTEFRSSESDIHDDLEGADDELD